MKIKTLEQAASLVSRLRVSDVLAVTSENHTGYIEIIDAGISGPIGTQLEFVNDVIVNSTRFDINPTYLIGLDIEHNPKRSSYIKKYPSQYEAELVLETLHALANIHTGYASNSNTVKIIQRATVKMNQEFQLIFKSPSRSPWDITIRNGKQTVVWRSEW